MLLDLYVQYPSYAVIGTTLALLVHYCITNGILSCISMYIITVRVSCRGMEASFGILNRVTKKKKKKEKKNGYPDLSEI